MPKPTKGKRLGGSSSHEDQIISNLISALIEHEKIETTVTKAKTVKPCLLYTSPSPRDGLLSRMPSSA